MRYRVTLHQRSEEAFRGTQRVSLNGRDKEGTRQGILCPAYSSRRCLQMALKDDVERWQKSKGMGIRLGDYESDCFTNLRFADDVLAEC